MADNALQALKTILQSRTDTLGRMTWDAWMTETGIRAAQTDLYRKYADGEHRAKLTQEMIDMLRLEGTTATTSSPFNLNHMDTIIQTMVDRLNLAGVQTDNEAGNFWADEVLKANRFNKLQLQVHKAAVRDGNAYIMAGFNNLTNEVEFTVESAYDGVEGIIPIFSGDRHKPAAAIKVWRQNISTSDGRGGFTLSEAIRINVYFPEKIEKYISKGSGGVLERWTDKQGDTWPYAWTVNGEPIGVPIVPYVNGATEYDSFGRSAIDDVITIQDALNRVLTSMVMATELTGFQVRTAIGTRPPQRLSPGMWVSVFSKDQNGVEKAPTKEQIDWLNAIKFGTLEVGQLAPFIEEANFLIGQMYTITRTPEDTASSSSSGEALKQREIGLLGKVRAAQVSFGDGWEALMGLAWRVQMAYGDTKPPPVKRFTAVWSPAEIRNTAQMVSMWLSMKDVIDEQTLLEGIGAELKWDAEKIAGIIKARGTAVADRMQALTGGIPRFGA